MPTQRVKNIVKNTSIIDRQVLAELDSEIREDEIDIFYYNE